MARLSQGDLDCCKFLAGLSCDDAAFSCWFEDNVLQVGGAHPGWQTAVSHETVCHHQRCS